jgi:hypothetical protein
MASFATTSGMYHQPKRKPKQCGMYLKGSKDGRLSFQCTCTIAMGPHMDTYSTSKLTKLDIVNGPYITMTRLGHITHTHTPDFSLFCWVRA